MRCMGRVNRSLVKWAGLVDSKLMGFENRTCRLNNQSIVFLFCWFRIAGEGRLFSWFQIVGSE